LSRALLDVNVLLALLDSDHVDHGRARAWISNEIEHGWASCAITENGFVRIISQPRYPSPVPPSQAVDLLTQATATEHHKYWPCTVSILDPGVFDRSRIHGSKQLTDSYLLALAAANEGRSVTFDQTVSVSSVRSATKEHLTVL